MNKQLVGTFFTEDQVTHYLVQIRCTKTGELYHTTNASSTEALVILKREMVTTCADHIWKYKVSCDELGVDLHDFNKEFVDSDDNRIAAFGFYYNGLIMLGGIAYDCRDQAFHPVGQMTKDLYDMFEEVCKEAGDKFDSYKKMKPVV